jgi:hypothetical protein
MAHPTPDTISSLTIELQDFCNREGLPQESADDLLVTHPALTESQRTWLTEYSARWDAINPPSDTRERLTAELRTFCDKEGLPQVSAEALIVNPALTAPQRDWLAEFRGRGDALHEPEDDWDDDDGDSDASGAR